MAFNYNTLYFGQGDARIYIADFVSYHRFVISKTDSNSGAIIPLDLTGSSISIVFKNSVGTLIKYASEVSDAVSPKSGGAVVFKLPADLAQKILTDSESKPFYIVSESTGAPETVIYTGSVDKLENVSHEIKRVKEIFNIGQPKIPIIPRPTPTNVVTPIAVQETVQGSIQAIDQIAPVSLIAELPLTNDPNKSILQNLTDANSASVNSIKSTPAVTPPVIPNYNYDTGASSIKKGLSPESQNNQSTSQGIVNTLLSQQEGPTIKLNP